MAGKVLNIKGCSPLKQLSGLTGKYHAICHYSYNLPLEFIRVLMENQDAVTRKIRSLIYKERPNTILAHFRTWFHGNERHYFGNISSTKFQIWRFTRGAQGFHPVITGQITSTEQDEPIINLKATLNPLGYLQAIVGTIGIIVLTVFIMPTDTNTIISFLVVFGVTLTLVGIVYFIYKYETRYHLKQLEEELNQFQTNERNELQQYV